MSGRAGLLAVLGLLLAAVAGALLWLGGGPDAGPVGLELGPAPGMAAGIRGADVAPAKDRVVGRNDPRAGSSGAGRRDDSSEARAAVTGGQSYVSLRVFFVGQPAPGAVVSVADVTGQARGLGSTDRAGVLLAPLEPGTRIVTVEYAGAARLSRTIVLAPGEARDLVFQLPRSKPIAGLVRGPDGQPVGAGAKIWAWDAELPGAGEVLRRSAGGSTDGRILRAETTKGGLFRIEGPEPDRSYRLAALAAGGLSDQGLVVAAGSRAEIKLRVAVARVVSFRTVAGESLMDAGLMTPGGGPKVDSLGSAKRFSLATNPELWHSNLGAQLRRLPAGTGPFGPQVVGVFLSQAEPAPDGQMVKVTLEHPDYVREEAMVRLVSLEEEGAWTEFVVKPNAQAEQGRLGVDARLSPSVSEALASDPRGLGQLHLTHESGRELVLELEPFSAMPMDGVRVPAGRWSARAVPRDGGFGIGGASAEVAAEFLVPAGGAHTLRLDLRAWSAARVRLGTGDDAWAGGAILSVESVDKRRRFLNLPHGPYVLLGLGEGTCTVSVQRLLGSTLRGSEEGTIEGPGSVLDLELVLSMGQAR